MDSSFTSKLRALLPGKGTLNSHDMYSRCTQQTAQDSSFHSRSWVTLHWQFLFNRIPRTVGCFARQSVPVLKGTTI